MLAVGTERVVREREEAEDRVADDRRREGGGRLEDIEELNQLKSELLVPALMAQLGRVVEDVELRGHHPSLCILVLWTLRPAGVSERCPQVEHW